MKRFWFKYTYFVNADYYHFFNCEAENKEQAIIKFEEHDGYIIDDTYYTVKEIGKKEPELSLEQLHNKIEAMQKQINRLVLETF